MSELRNFTIDIETVEQFCKNRSEHLRFGDSLFYYGTDIETTITQKYTIAVENTDDDEITFYFLKTEDIHDYANDHRIIFYVLVNSHAVNMNIIEELLQKINQKHINI